MFLDALIQHARHYCDWAEADSHDMETVYELLLSLRNAAEQLQSSSGPEEPACFADLPYEVQYEEMKRFADFPFQCYYPSYWPGRPLPLAEDIWESFAWTYAELRRGLEAMDREEVVDLNGYWHYSYAFRWGHHASAAIWAIEWHKDGEPGAPSNDGPAQVSGNPSVAGRPPSMS